MPELYLTHLTKSDDICVSEYGQMCMLCTLQRSLQQIFLRNVAVLIDIFGDAPKVISVLPGPDHVRKPMHKNHSCHIDCTSQALRTELTVSQGQHISMHPGMLL